MSFPASGLFVRADPDENFAAMPARTLIGLRHANARSRYFLSGSNLTPALNSRAIYTF